MPHRQPAAYHGAGVGYARRIDTAGPTMPRPILDEALIAAAELSHRYISERKLPDKAIDLIDEAASSIRMQIDSKPEELDRLDRRVGVFDVRHDDGPYWETWVRV